MLYKDRLIVSIYTTLVYSIFYILLEYSILKYSDSLIPLLRTPGGPSQHETRLNHIEPSWRGGGSADEACHVTRTYHSLYTVLVEYSL